MVNYFFKPNQLATINEKITKSNEVCYIEGNWNATHNALNNPQTASRMANMRDGEYWGDGATSPCSCTFNLWSLNGSYTRIQAYSGSERFYAVASGYPTTPQGNSRPCGSVDVHTTSWTNDTTNMGFSASYLYCPDYNSGLQTEINQIFLDVYNGLDPAPLWEENKLNSKLTTPIYLNRLTQDKTPFYEPLRSTRAGRMNILRD